MLAKQGVSCRVQRRGVELLSAKVPLGICTEDCVLHCFGCRVANPAAASSASFAQLFCDDLYRIAHTFPLQCTILPMTSGVLWRGVRLTGLVATRQCTFLLLPFLRSLVFVPFSEQTFEGSQVWLSIHLEALKLFHGGYGYFLEDLKVLLQPFPEVEPACD